VVFSTVFFQDPGMDLSVLPTHGSPCGVKFAN
jgi:hypothetical protein